MAPPSTVQVCAEVQDWPWRSTTRRIGNRTSRPCRRECVEDLDEHTELKVLHRQPRTSGHGTTVDLQVCAEVQDW
jgi:hypothetical protein